MEVEMKIRGLMMDPVTNMPIVILKDVNGTAILPIWVGIYEANAIALEIEKVNTPRPNTHDLIKNVLLGLDAGVQKVVVNDLRDGVPRGASVTVPDSVVPSCGRMNRTPSPSEIPAGNSGSTPTWVVVESLTGISDVTVNSVVNPSMKKRAPCVTVPSSSISSVDSPPAKRVPGSLTVAVTRSKPTTCTWPVSSA